MKIFYSAIRLFLVICLTTNIWAIQAKSSAKLYDHLVDVNKNWSKVDPAFFQEYVRFHNDIDRIQRHLLEVENLLRRSNVNSDSPEAMQKRSQMLDVLHVYALKGKFPVNTHHSARQPYFIDEFGTHCAVGYLVKESGFPEISLAISKTQNYAYVAQIQSKELLQWCVDFGFTLDELALIQPGYPPTQSYSQVGGGTNGSVTCSKTHSNRLYIGGNFSELDSLPCLNVGFYENNQLSCFGNGISGKIIGISEFGANGVIVAGEFESNGTIYPIAKYDGSNWSYVAIPSVPNAKATSFVCTNNGLDMKISVSSPSIIGGQEVWFFIGSWVKLAFVPGIVHAMNFDYSSIFGGHFDSVQITNASTPYWVSANNFVVANNGNWESASTWVPDTVFTILSQGNSVYLGGHAGSGSYGTALCKFLNGVAQPLISNSTTSSPLPLVVKCLSKYSETKMFVGGQLEPYPLFGTYGKNLMMYDLFNSTITPIALLDSTVLTVSNVQGRYYFGGDFTKYEHSPLYSMPLNHLIVLDEALGLTVFSKIKSIDIYPNPSPGNLKISGIQSHELKTIEIFNTQGKSVLKSEDMQIDAPTLEAGIYLVRINLQNGQTAQKRWVKQ